VIVLNKGYQWGTLFLFGIWSLWLQRNKFIFQQVAPSPNLQHSVEMLVKEFTYSGLNCEQPKNFVVKIVKWDKPPDRWFKLNTDGSVAGNLGPAGCGGTDKRLEWRVA
jgi:hypothetical protein